MITKETIISQINILEYGQLNIQQITYIVEDGIRIAQALPHRYVINPGQFLGNEDTKVRAVAEAVHTPAVITAWQRAEAARRG